MDARLASCLPACKRVAWLAGLALVVAAILVLIVWDLGIRGGNGCAGIVDHFVLCPEARGRRRARAGEVS
jgi:hypothetical protein